MLIMNIIQALADSFDSIGSFFSGLLSFIFLALTNLVYGAINYVYQVYMAIASARLFSNNTFSSVVSRIYILFGVVALFLVAYALLMGIINPDKEMGGISLKKVIPNIAIAIVGVAVVPFVFNYLYQFQDLVISKNVIGGIFFGNGADEDVDTDYWLFKDDSGNVVLNKFNNNLCDLTYDVDTSVCSNASMNYSIGGKSMAVSLFQSFFYIAADGSNITSIDKYLERNWTYNEAIRYAKCSGDFEVFSVFTQEIMEKVVVYHPILSLLAGGFCLYVLISFCIDMALRMVKLGYFQLIAPIPLLMNIIPGQEKVLKNWLHSCFSTYLEVFARLIIIFFVTFMIQKLPNIFGDLWSSSSVLCAPSDNLQGMAECLIIIGLLMFLKQAPGLFSKMFGIESSGFKLGIGDKLKDAGLFRAAAAAGGGITAAVRNGASVGSKNGFKAGAISALGGLGSGLKNGWKNAKDVKDFKGIRTAAGSGAATATANRLARENYKNSHLGKFGTLKGHFDDSLQNIQDWANYGSSYDNYKKEFDMAQTTDPRKAVRDIARADDSNTRSAQRNLDNFQNGSMSLEEAFSRVNDDSSEFKQIAENMKNHAVTAKERDIIAKKLEAKRDEAQNNYIMAQARIKGSKIYSSLAEANSVIIANKNDAIVSNSAHPLDNLLDERGNVKSDIIAALDSNHSNLELNINAVRGSDDYSKAVAAEKRRQDKADTKK